MREQTRQNITYNISFYAATRGAHWSLYTRTLLFIRVFSRRWTEMFPLKTSKGVKSLPHVTLRQNQIFQTRRESTMKYYKILLVLNAALHIILVY